MSGEFAGLLGGEYIAESQNQKEATANTAFDRLAAAANDTLEVACAPGTVTIAEADFQQYAILKLTGSLAGSPSDCEVVLPNSARRLSIINATDGLVTISSGEAAETSLEADESADIAVIEDDGVYKLAGSSGGGGGAGDFVGPASAVSGNLVAFGDTTGKLGADAGVVPSTDGTFAANSDAKLPTEKAVKTYVAAAVTGLLDLKGDTDASANPNYPAASKGDAYYITVAGKIGGASGKTVEVGDVYVAKADNAGGTEASVGTSWFVLEHNLLGALLAANNLSDLANATTARTNLGLGTVATLASDTDTTLATNSDARVATQKAVKAYVDAVATAVGKHAVYIAAGSMSPSVTGGCAALAGVATTANRPDLRTLDFDASTEEYAQFSMVMPKSWNEGTLTARFHWSHPATTTNFAVVWGIQAVAVSDDDAIDAAFGTAQTVTDTGGTTSDLYTSAETAAMTVAGSPAAEDMVFFRVYRKAADGSDTMAVDARLHGITIYLTTDAGNDA